MTFIARRTFLTLALAAVPAAYASRAFAVDALPDARFVGYAQAHNDFEIASARLRSFLVRKVCHSFSKM